MAMDGFVLNEERYLRLLEKLIGETEFLQDNPPKFVPQEDKAIAHLLDLLRPHSKENGGPLSVEHVVYVEGRGNLILEYSPEGATENTVAFVGSHLDVVPANPETWERNPFKLCREGDKLYGRGTTDCLGHVALITDLFLQLAEKKPKLKFKVIAIFIAAEESTAIPGVGIDKMVEQGRLEHLKGPIYWVDSADSQPCMGTAGCAMWTLRVTGRLFHSGLPHKGINSAELAMEAIAYLQEKFYKDYPPHPEEERYKFASPSTFKPTQMRCSEGSINQLPPWTELQGDIRLTPFYNISDCIDKLKAYVKELNEDITVLPTRGPCSKYVVDLPEGHFEGKLELTLEGDPFKGIACKLDSKGFKHLCDATEEVMGVVEPYSITGSLPLVGDLQEAGFDVQVCGYGHSSVYHGDNEYCTLSHMERAFRVLCSILKRHN